MLTNKQLQSIVENILYCTLVKSVNVNDNEVKIFHTEIVLKKIEDVISKKYLGSTNFQLNSVINCIQGTENTYKNPIEERFDLIVRDIENFTLSMSSGMPYDLQIAKGIDYGVLMIIVDKVMRGTYSTKKTNAEILKEVKNNVKKNNREFYRELKPHIRFLSSSFLEKLANKTPQEQIDLLMEWCPTKELNNFYDVVKIEQTLEERYAEIIYNFYQDNMIPHFIVGNVGEKDISIKYYKQTVLPLILRARRKMMQKRGEKETDEESYIAHIKYLKTKI